MVPGIHHSDILLIVRANYLAHQSYCNNYTIYTLYNRIIIFISSMLDNDTYFKLGRQYSLHNVLENMKEEKHTFTKSCSMRKEAKLTNMHVGNNRAELCLQTNKYIDI